MTIQTAGGGDLRTSIALGITQTIGYGTLYYAYGVLAPAMAADTGYSLTAIFGLFSLALLAGGIVAPFVGRALDRYNAARVMAFGSAVSALMLALWALAPGKIGFAVFAVLVEMVSVMVLYEAAFVLAARLAPSSARRTMTGITLIAGFASTIFWPLTTWLSGFLSWREVYLVYAGMNLLVCAPVHLWLSRPVARDGSGSDPDVRPAAPAAAVTDPRQRRIAFYILIVALAANAYVTSAVNLHLLGLLSALGFGASAAFIGALLGPAQVAGRIVELMAGERVSVLSVAIFSVASLPVALCLLLAGAGILPAALGFMILFGLGQGLTYIVRGVLPLHVFGPEGYGTLTGKINSIRLFVAAGAPFATAALFERAGVGVAVGTLIAAGVVGMLGLVALVPVMKKAALPPPSPKPD